MATRSYVPRHAVVVESDSSERGGFRTGTAVVATLGAAAATTLALAAPAQAAPHYAVWNRVANCESSGNWHINTGNGYYGGLQFSASTWRAYGGGRYAGEASRASRLEQIEVARRVLHSQGPHAWPVCGPRAGLNRSNGHATGRALPADPARAEHRSAHRAHAEHHRAHAEHHRAHAEHHRARAEHHRAARHRANGHPKYRVRSGDTLSKIAARHHVGGGWRHLYRLNRGRISDPNQLYVGQVILLP